MQIAHLKLKDVFFVYILRSKLPVLEDQDT